MSLFTDKPLVVQVLSEPEILSIQETGDVVVLVQRWHRSTWTLGDRLEVHLQSKRAVKSIFTGIGSLLGINKPENIRVLKVSKFGSDILLHRLASDKPSGNAISSVEWVNPLLEGDLELKRARKLTVTDGDLLLIQDITEPLRELSVAEKDTINVVSAEEEEERRNTRRNGTILAPKPTTQSRRGSLLFAYLQILHTIIR